MKELQLAINTSYNLSAIHLGGGRRPDVLAYNDNFGIIVDTKAYKNGYGRNVNQEDEWFGILQKTRLENKISAKIIGGSTLVSQFQVHLIIIYG